MAPKQLLSLLFFNRMECEQTSGSVRIQSLLVHLNRYGGFEPPPPEVPYESPVHNSIHEANSGCPISRVFCEKWGFLSRRLAPQNVKAPIVNRGLYQVSARRCPSNMPSVTRPAMSST